ncbi:zinc finger and BTB domain-containing protein 24-like isoform X2 [Mya arenaria]|uniref:zinc finger and BTB domain-containing protein 24-like isoform X2 n=1 Tax=Mya arenaria TaxID=6604 RepID=UPI0022E0AFFB|nr:zinc finger and BTB domain-containing protein 24-like isoform X2 [Mya arenaria]
MGATELEDVREMPGFTTIVKTVFKCLIQQLVEFLAEYTGDEALVLTACVADNTVSHLASSFGDRFLDGQTDLKAQFLRHCIRKKYKSKEDSMVQGYRENSKENSMVQGYRENSQLGYRENSQLGYRKNSQLFRNDGKGRNNGNIVQHCPNEVEQHKEVEGMSGSSKNRKTRRRLFRNRHLGNRPLATSSPVRKLAKLAVNKSTEFEDGENTSFEVDSELESIKGVDVNVPPLGEESGRGKENEGLIQVEDELPSLRIVDVMTLKRAGISDDTASSLEVEVGEVPKTARKSEKEGPQELDSSSITFYVVESNNATCPEDCKKIIENAQKHSKTVWNTPDVRETTPVQQPCPKRQYCAYKESNPVPGELLQSKGCLMHSCHICGKMFMARTYLEAHIEDIHTDENRNHTCQQCAKVFQTKMALCVHTINEHPVKHTCDFCGLVCDTKSTLSDHMMNEHVSKAYTCPKPGCGKTFGYVSSLKRHEVLCHSKASTPKLSFTCQKCHKVLGSRESLADHIQGVHKEGKLYVCGCGKTSGWRSTHVRHRKACKFGNIRLQQNHTKQLIEDKTRL